MIGSRILDQEFTISSLSAGGGDLGICPIPGRFGGFDQDLQQLIAWRPDLVLSLTSQQEIDAGGAGAMGAQLAANGIDWHHVPIVDFSTPEARFIEKWPKTSAQCMAVLANGGRIVAHCKGGCGRSGMVLLRLMVELGEPFDAAFRRLRQVRACAVETKAQQQWASEGAA